MSTWEVLISFGLMLLALSGVVTHAMGRAVALTISAVLFAAAGLIALGVIV